MRTATRNAFFETNAGWATVLAAAATFTYAIWIYAIPHTLTSGEFVSNLLDALLSIALFVYSVLAFTKKKIDPLLRRSWIILICAFFSSAIGECLWFFKESILQTEPFLSSADIFYFLYYPLLLIAVLLLPYASLEPNESKVLAMDLAIVLTTSFVFLWYFLLVPAGFGEGPHAGALLAIAYPIGEIVILAALIALLQRQVKAIGWWTLIFLGLGLTMDALADGSFAYLNVRGLPAESGWMNVLWLSSYVFMLAAVAWETITEKSVRTKMPVRFGSGRLLRTAIPYGAAVAVLFLMMLAVRNTHFSDIRFQGVLAGTLLLALEVLIRQYLVL